jgi:cobalt/nickel transport system permease protein
MIDNWVGHYHSHRESPVSRLPAALKLGVALVMIVGTVLIPSQPEGQDARMGVLHHGQVAGLPYWAVGWFIAMALLLVVTVALSRLPVWFLLKRLVWLSPFILGVALVNALQPAARGSWLAVALKSTICLLTVVVVSNTTPFSKVLRVLKSARVPGLLITTIALMHRYLFVMVEEAERMRRARAGRTFTRQRRAYWQGSSSVVGQLFVRASERAERIYDAMCARGWK